MLRTTKAVKLLSGLVLLAFADLGAVAGITLMSAQPAAAQFFDQRYQPQRPRSFFESLFGGGSRPRPEEREIRRDIQRDVPPRDVSVDSSRPPPPTRKDVKTDSDATTSVVVMGDGMADWLAYGLEDAFADTPEVAIVRKAKPYSGLLRAEPNQEWWRLAHDILANEKASYVIMMLGVADRQGLRDKDVAKEEQASKEQAAKDQASKDQANKDQANKDQAGNPANQLKNEVDAEQSIVAPEPKPAPRSANGMIEFRSEPWEKVYTRRIDDTIAALKSKGVPVFWVGLPSIRGAKSTADTGYLNDLYRARAQKAGAIYIDVWDGFIDEAGQFTTFGPDYEGQTRRLRSADGVFFTKFGARKLAHYVEREIRRYMTNRGPIALPMGPSGPLPADVKSAARPVAGPVVPLTTLTGNNDELLGGGTAARADASASAVLVRGDALPRAPGRADDFIWSSGVATPKAETSAAAPVAAVTPAAPAMPAAAPVAIKPDAAPAAIMKPEAPANPAAVTPAERKTAPVAAERPRPAAANERPTPPPAVDPRAPRPPQDVAQQPPRPREGGLFGLFR